MTKPPPPLPETCKIFSTKTLEQDPYLNLTCQMSISFHLQRDIKEGGKILRRNTHQLFTDSEHVVKPEMGSSSEYGYLLTE